MEKKLNFLAIIQARMGSTRLPGKVMLPLAGKPVFECVYERVALSQHIDKVIIATTTNKHDDQLTDACHRKGISVFRGAEEDVLDRYYQVASHYRCNNIIRIMADCPLIDYRIIDKAIKKHVKEKNDYTSTAYIETFPDGEDVDIFTFQTLSQAWKEAKELFQREHITQYVVLNPVKFKIGNLSYKQNLSNKRWTLDEPCDYLFIKAIYKALGKKNILFGMGEILAHLAQHPELEKLNQHIIRNEGLLKSLKKINNKNKRK